MVYFSNYFLLFIQRVVKALYHNSEVHDDLHLFQL